MSRLRRFDEGVARGEAALAMTMLLFMLVVAFAQAALRNLSQLGWGWANAALDFLDFADFVLEKGTLWLAFLGASLAVRADKHISIDILPRMVSPKARILMAGCARLVSAVICFLLGRAFWDAVLINGEEASAAFEVITMEGSIHVCDATLAQVVESGAKQPALFCGIRSLFNVIHLRLDTPGAAFQLIVPVMFMFMSVRLFAYGINSFIRVKNGDISDDPSAHGIVGSVSDVAHDLDQKKGA